MNTLHFVRNATVLFGLGFSMLLHAADPASPPPLTLSGKVDINTAEVAALEAIPEIGTDLANAVVAARPFKSVDDLARVSGLGPEKMKTLLPKVVASPVKPTAPTEPDPRTGSGPSKPSTVKDGKATSGQEVTERYDKTTKPAPAKEKRPSENPPR